MNRNDIKKLMDQMPYLHIYGVGFTREIYETMNEVERMQMLERCRQLLLDSEEKCDIAYECLRTIEKTKNINNKISSYEMKILMELMTGQPFFCGQFVCGALHAGFRIKVIKFDPSPFFNMSYPSIAKKKRLIEKQLRNN